MPIIDLTATEDAEHQLFEESISRPMIELNKTPPLDANGNEILITTDTKTMQAISYRKTNDKIASKKPKEIPIQMNHDKLFSAQSSVSPSKTVPSTNASALSIEMAKPIMFMNVNKKNGHRMPPKEQIKLVEKYNRWLHEHRIRNGYRLFAAQNLVTAQQHASENKSNYNAREILCHWWDSIPPSEKEQYSKIADILLKKKSLSTQNTKNEVTKGANTPRVRGYDHNAKRKKAIRPNKKNGNGVNFDPNSQTSDSLINLLRTKQ